MNLRKGTRLGIREVLVIILASRKWRKYLRAASEVVILSEHNPLVLMRGQRVPLGKFSKWLLEVEALNYRVELRRGLDNCAAYCLSRSSIEFD